MDFSLAFCQHRLLCRSSHEALERLFFARHSRIKYGYLLNRLAHAQERNQRRFRERQTVLYKSL